MSYLALFFMITSIVVIALIAWSYTKSGEKWLKELLYYELFGIVLFSLLNFWPKFYRLDLHQARRKMA